MSALECAEYNAAIDKQSENEHDLAIWWEAFRVALPVQYFDTDEMCIRIAGTTGMASALADLALAAYKAKAAELAGKK